MSHDFDHATGLLEFKLRVNSAWNNILIFWSNIFIGSDLCLDFHNESNQFWQIVPYPITFFNLSSFLFCSVTNCEENCFGQPSWSFGKKQIFCVNLRFGEVWTFLWRQLCDYWYYWENVNFPLNLLIGFGPGQSTIGLFLFHK